MKNLLAIALTLALSALSLETAIAQEASPEVDRIVVDGIKNPQVIPYASLRKGEDAFKTHHALAPAAILIFALWPKGKSASAGELDLRLRSDEQSLHVPVKDMAFTLPDTHEVNFDNPELAVINRQRDSVSWSAKVRSPDLSPNTMRLGDLRLECEVNFAAFVGSAPLMLRMGLKMRGQLCRSPKTSVDHYVGATVTSVELAVRSSKLVTK